MRVVKEMPARQSLARHNWELLCDGKIRELIPGDDFKCSIPSFRAMFHMESKRRKKRARASVRDGKMYIVAVELTAKRNGK